MIKEIAAEETAKKREESRTAQPLADGMELRIGDCRAGLRDGSPRNREAGWYNLVSSRINKG